MANNFLLFDQNGANLESDGSYATDGFRLNGGVVNSACPSAGFNKAMYQATVGVAALMQMMTNKGFSVNDGSASPGTAVANLAAVLANIVVASSSLSLSDGTNTTVLNTTSLSIPAGSASITLGSTVLEFNGSGITCTQSFEVTGAITAGSLILSSAGIEALLGNVSAVTGIFTCQGSNGYTGPIAGRSAVGGIVV